MTTKPLRLRSRLSSFCLVAPLLAQQPAGTTPNSGKRSATLTRS
ncbi:MAG: hypothetical protein ACK501_14450 [Planctomycetota bacterium]